jgi:capsular polysaccharide biosynthesis protein
MDLRQYWRALRRRAWLAALLMALTIIGTALVTFLSKPQYTATATVLANSPATSSDKTLGFSDVLTSNVLLINVSQQLHLNESVDSLSKRIKVDNGRTSNLYLITVSDSDPGQAAKIANAVAQESTRLYMDLGSAPEKTIASRLGDETDIYLQRYIAASQALLDFQHSYPNASTDPNPGIRSQLATLQLQEKAAEDSYLDFSSSLTKAQVNEISNPSSFDARVVDVAAAKTDTRSRQLNILYAAGLGLLIGLAAIFALEYFDASVHEPEEAEQLVGAPVIGVIAHGDARTLHVTKGR